MSPQKVLAAPRYLVMKSRPSGKVTDTSSDCNHLQGILKGEWKTTEDPRNQRGSRRERQLELEQRPAGGAGLARFLPSEGHCLTPSGRLPGQT